MEKQIKLLIILFMMTASCNQEVVDEFKLTGAEIKEIDDLTTQYQKQSYLESIFKSDQTIREICAGLIVANGLDSIEHKNCIRENNEIDAINLLKIEYFLEKYGYPSKSVYGEIAAYTPFLIIHHSDSKEARFRNFNYLNNAYHNQDIKESSFLLYLNRFYRMTYGKPFNKNTEVDEVSALIDILELNEHM